MTIHLGSVYPRPLASVFKNSRAIESGEGEKVKRAWITLFDSTLNIELDAPTLIATPNDSLLFFQRQNIE